MKLGEMDLLAAVATLISGFATIVAVVMTIKNQDKGAIRERNGRFLETYYQKRLTLEEHRDFLKNKMDDWWLVVRAGDRQEKVDKIVRLVGDFEKSMKFIEKDIGGKITYDLHKLLGVVKGNVLVLNKKTKRDIELPQSLARVFGDFEFEPIRKSIWNFISGIDASIEELDERFHSIPKEHHHW